MSTAISLVSAMILVAAIDTGLTQAQTLEEHERARSRMVELYVRAAGVGDQRVLRAMLKTPRPRH